MADIDLTKLFDKIISWASSPLFAGFIGSVISLKWIPGKGFLGRLFNLCAGLAIVRYAAPVVVDVFNVQTDSIDRLMAFVIGMFGVNLASQISTGIKKTEFAAIFTSYLTIFTEYFRKR